MVPGAERQVCGVDRRYYRASIRQHVEDCTGAIEESRQKRLLARLKEGPRPRKGRRPRRTSARKRKTFPFPEYEVLLGHLKTRTRDADLAAEFLKHTCVLLMRKREWETAAIIGGCLVVNNAKHTNGRSLGPTRKRRLDNYGADDVESLRMLLVRLKARAAESGFNRLWQRMASLIARACKRIKLPAWHPIPPDIRAWPTAKRGCRMSKSPTRPVTRPHARPPFTTQSGGAVGGTRSDKSARRMTPTSSAWSASIRKHEWTRCSESLLNARSKGGPLRERSLTAALPPPSPKPRRTSKPATPASPRRTGRLNAQEGRPVLASVGRRDDNPRQGIAAQTAAPRSTRAAEPKSARTKRTAASPLRWTKPPMRRTRGVESNHARDARRRKPRPLQQALALLWQFYSRYYPAPIHLRQCGHR
jgi:hypothetical protein